MLVTRASWHTGVQGGKATLTREGGGGCGGLGGLVESRRSARRVGGVDGVATGGR